MYMPTAGGYDWALNFNFILYACTCTCVLYIAAWLTHTYNQLIFAESALVIVPAYRKKSMAITINRNIALCIGIQIQKHVKLSQDHRLNLFPHFVMLDDCCRVQFSIFIQCAIIRKACINNVRGVEVYIVSHCLSFCGSGHFYSQGHADSYFNLH